MQWRRSGEPLDRQDLASYSALMTKTDAIKLLGELKTKAQAAAQDKERVANELEGIPFAAVQHENARADALYHKQEMAAIDLALEALAYQVDRYGD